MKALLGTKIRMEMAFNSQGRAVGVSIVEAGPCRVAAVRRLDKDGYQAVQLAFRVKIKREVPLEDGDQDVKPGQEFKAAEVFRAGDMVQVTGVTKGKGFAGVVKRHGFAGGPRTHGQSDRERAPGSIGATTTPGRVYKGKKMAGRMGGQRQTVRKLKVIKVDGASHRLYLLGAVPGVRGGLVVIKKN